MDVEFIIDAEDDYAAFSPVDEEIAYINPGNLLKNFETIRKPLDIDINDDGFMVFVSQISEICFHEFIHIFSRQSGEIPVRCRHGPKDRCYFCELTTRLMEFEKAWIKFSIIPSTG